MDPFLAETLAPFLALLSVGTTVLIGMKIRYNYLARMKSAEANDEIQRLTNALEGLNDNMRLLRDEVLDLQERVDFTERMLTKGSEADAQS